MQFEVHKRSQKGTPSKKIGKAKGGREENARTYLQKKQCVNNFWIRIVKRKWGSQIDKFLATLYIKRMQFEVYKRFPSTSCQVSGNHCIDKYMIFHILCMGFCS